MPLSSGSKLGPYQILEVIGAGGMGEVYRAKDTRLDRTVAIKVLPKHLSSNQNLKERLEREARAVSALNHPSICTLHDIGQQDGIDFLVMEYIEGETLASRLSKGALPLEQTLRYAVQIADALDKAHRQGIVHRDLKPGNVMLTKSGVKLLDFGLAKLQKSSAVQLQPNVSTLATEIAQNLTAEGSIIGTLQYMSPEQLEGRETDARTDIFAFGAVLYEMVTGKKAFTGKSQASLISAILKEEPIPVSRIQPIAPPSLDRVVKMCLAKDPDDRWQTAHDLMSELQWISGASSELAVTSASAPRKSRMIWIAAAALFLIFGAAGWIAYFNRNSPPQKMMQLSILSPPDNELVDAPVISPDGSRIVFSAADKNGKAHLWIRTLESTDAQQVLGTEGANSPFWSPDSRNIGFFAKGKLFKVEASGGVAQALCDVSDPRGGTWSKDGIILFSPNPGDGLYRISSTGGVPAKVTSLDPATQETTHRFPYFLPDGTHFLFYDKLQKGESGVYIGSLDSNKKFLLSPSDRSAVFASGHLLFQRSSTLLAQAFDVKELKLSGEAIPVSDNVWYEPQTMGTRGMSVSDNGLLNYVEGSNRTQLLWFDHNGNQQGSVSPPDQYGGAPSFSPDGKRFAIQVIDGLYSHIWLYESSGGNRSRLTFSPSYDAVPRWSPDGTRIVFNSDRTGPFQLLMRDASGTGNDERIYQSKGWCFPDDWSPDSQYILFEESDPKTKFNLWVLKVNEKKAFPFLVTEAIEANAMFSPDGKWVAYSSNESGRPEIYVQPFLTEKAGKWQVSTNGGYTPKWNKNGKELFYLSLDNQIMSSEVKLGSIFEATTPKPLFSIHPYVAQRIGNNAYSSYEPAPDGRFVVHAALTDSQLNITVVLNWPLLLNPKK